MIRLYNFFPSLDIYISLLGHMWIPLTCGKKEMGEVSVASKLFTRD